ncbi:GPI anchored cell wall protein [Lasiodiplodia theobromae]|uniref:GPI anchored cell wall protein n=1 Tax=Lasiodiplodia theobromae TaxID=45133 RepID=UPI0015C36FA7|nr:GPI anchored cell wall protein [Lasiodiplodia theobromae]KAF4534942.1 GPI anchored cell wall protein [Lasiodiplodia theobromae]
MKTAAVALGLAASALAAPAPSAESLNQQCCFGISAYGVKGSVSEGFWGNVKQLPDGQLRIGQTNLQYDSSFCTNSWSYSLYDQNHFGCVLAGWEKQFQCDHGKASWTGWHIGYEGIVTLHGSAQWWACPTGDHSGHNIYKAPLPGDYCSEVTLVANRCRAAELPICQHSSLRFASLHPVDSHPLEVREFGVRSGCLNRSSRCPGELSGNWEFPHLIVPVESNRPDFAPGTSFFGTVSKSVKSYFNFDIPGHYSGKTCTVRFMFPEQWQLETSSFELRGLGHVYAGWTRGVSKSTTYSTAPQCENRNAFTFRPGNSYVLSRAQCTPGVMGFYIEGVSDTYLRWFQDFNPCPIGLYLTAE